MTELALLPLLASIEHRPARRRCPMSGPAILISNHTCGIDHMLLQVDSRRLLGFMVAREYYEWRVDSLDLPVHRLHPGQSRRPRFRRDPSGLTGIEGRPRAADLSRGPHRAGIGPADSMR